MSTDAQFEGDVVSFNDRAPSQTWDAYQIFDAPETVVWVWFKPANLPQGLILRVPDETHRAYPHAGQLTFKKLLLSIGIKPSHVTQWQMFGHAYDSMNGTSPYFDQAVPAAPPGVDANITVHINAWTEVFDRIEADWNLAQQIEKHLQANRKALTDMNGRLKGLNRDLTFQENLHSSQQDKKDWTEARRWLRDSMMQIARHIKEYDTGETIYAGKRHWFQQTYDNFVRPRQLFQGIEQARRDFEAHRKVLQTLESNMSGAYNYAQLNGERRATEVMKRITQKVRDAQVKKTALGVLLDK
ncbi:MAG: hypothetical protein CMJ78_20830 [Planctomycetaceae bacterium]|nr:hypothetical protein [Planctomycetaceae bacterium]